MRRDELAAVVRAARPIPAGSLDDTQYLGVDLSQADVYAMTVGGVKVTEPAADLAVCIAAVSSATGAPISPGVVACGEVGLGGELRQVRRIERRLAEAARLGFTTAVVPHSTPTVAVPMEVLRVPSLRVALDTVGLLEH